jgi:hypothetical protein
MTPVYHTVYRYASPHIDCLRFRHWTEWIEEPWREQKAVYVHVNGLDRITVKSRSAKPAAGVGRHVDTQLNG